LFRHEANNLKQPKLFVIRDGCAFIAKAGVASRTITTPEGDMTVLALLGVAVTPERRGKQLGAAVVRKAFESVDAGQFTCSLFQTDVPGFYEKLNALLCDNQFVDSTSDDPAARPWWSEFVMVYPADADWPVGKVDLNGPGY